MAERLEVMPVRGIGEITPGTDLAGVIVAAAGWLRDGDILVVTSKVVSKAEGRLADVPAGGPERDAAREALLATETARPVARRGATRIVQTHHGFVLAGAGIDASNVEPTRLVMLPKDPDASARGLRSALRDRFGLNVAVIVSDTMGRPWRNGLTDVALGVAGIEPMLDYRGQTDPYGNELHITQMAVVDELAGAAELVKGKADRVPVAVVRGYPYPPSDGPGAGVAWTEESSDEGASDEGRRRSKGPRARASGASAIWHGPGALALVRAADADLFSMGTAEAHAAGLRDAAALPDATRFGADTVDASAVAHALASVPPSPGVTLEPDGIDGLPPGTTHAVRCRVASDTHLVAAGVHIHRLRCALAAEGLTTAWIPADGPPLDARLVGRLAIGPPHLRDHEVGVTEPRRS